MNSLRSVLSERFSKDVDSELAEQGDIEIEISNTDSIDDEQALHDSNLQNENVEEGISDSEDWSKSFSIVVEEAWEFPSIVRFEL